MFLPTKVLKMDSQSMWEKGINVTKFRSKKTGCLHFKFSGCWILCCCDFIMITGAQLRIFWHRAKPHNVSRILGNKANLLVPLVMRVSHGGMQWESKRSVAQFTPLTLTDSMQPAENGGIPCQPTVFVWSVLQMQFLIVLSQGVNTRASSDNENEDLTSVDMWRMKLEKISQILKLVQDALKQRFFLGDNIFFYERKKNLACICSGSTRFWCH